MKVFNFNDPEVIEKITEEFNEWWYSIGCYQKKKVNLSGMQFIN